MNALSDLGSQAHSSSCDRSWKARAWDPYISSILTTYQPPPPGSKSGPDRILLQLENIVKGLPGRRYWTVAALLWKLDLPSNTNVSKAMAGVFGGDWKDEIGAITTLDLHATAVGL